MRLIPEVLKRISLPHLEPFDRKQLLAKRVQYNNANARYAGILAILVSVYLLINNLQSTASGPLPQELYRYYRNIYLWMLGTGLVLALSEFLQTPARRRLHIGIRILAYTLCFFLVTLLLAGDFGPYRDYSAFIVIQFLLGQLISTAYWLYPAIFSSHLALALILTFKSDPLLFMREQAWALPILFAAMTLAIAVSSEASRRKTWLAEVELNKANEALREASFIDPLTGLYNRRYLSEVLKSACATIKRGGGDLAVIMVDIDHFKSINDRYGHTTGDAILSHLAKIIQDSLRDSDIAARYGGEEFIIALPRTNITGGLNTAERLLESIRTSIPPQLDHPVSASAGIATLGPDGQPGDMIHRADMALYQAKKQGRDRAVADS